MSEFGLVSSRSYEVRKARLVNGVERNICFFTEVEPCTCLEHREESWALIMTPIFRTQDLYNKGEGSLFVCYISGRDR
jgi:hypothetical protein